MAKRIGFRGKGVFCFFWVPASAGMTGVWEFDLLGFGFRRISDVFDGRVVLLVTVLFFAGARERVGTGRVVVEVDGGGCLGDAVDEALEMAGRGVALPSNVMLARNGVYVDRSVEVFDGDEVAVIPPVSGGAGDDDGSARVWVTGDAIDGDEVVRLVGSDRDGAVVVFHGITRDHNEGRRVLWLEYEAYSPMAEDVMSQIVGEMREKWEIGEVAVCHRTGRVDIGETSMVLAVSAAHRRPAFESALYFIDRLKEVVPIWKKEYFEGGEVWIGETPG